MTESRYCCRLSQTHPLQTLPLMPILKLTPSRSPIWRVMLKKLAIAHLPVPAKLSSIRPCRDLRVALQRSQRMPRSTLSVRSLRCFLAHWKKPFTLCTIMSAAEDISGRKGKASAKTVWFTYNSCVSKHSFIVRNPQASSTPLL